MMASARMEQNMNHAGPPPMDGKGNPGTGYGQFMNNQQRKVKIKQFKIINDHA